MRKTFHVVVAWQGNCGLPDFLQVYRSLPKAEHALRVREQKVRRLQYSGRIETPQGIQYSTRRDCNTDLFTVSCEIDKDVREAWVVVFIVHDKIEVKIKSTQAKADASLFNLTYAYEFDEEEMGVDQRHWDDLSRCYVRHVSFKEYDEEDTGSDTSVSTLRSSLSSSSSSNSQKTLSVGDVSD